MSQSQVFSQQEIERLSRQLEMLQKDAELERLYAVDKERRNQETKEDRLSKQLDATLKKLERAEEQIEHVHQREEHVHQREEHALLQFHDEASNHSGPVVPSSEPEITASHESLWLPLEHPPALTPLSITPSMEPVIIHGLSTVSSPTDEVISHSTQSYQVALAGLSSIPSVTDLISDSTQSHVITNSAVSPLQLPVFSMATVVTQSERVLEMGKPYSLTTIPIATPSVSWTGQRPLPLSCSSRQIVAS